MIDFEAGWRAVPGWLSPADGAALQNVVKTAPADTSIVELGAGCGRSLSCICEVLPTTVNVYSYDSYPERSQAFEGAEGPAPIPAHVAKKLWELTRTHWQERGCVITLRPQDSVHGGRVFQGPPVSVLFVDSHHSNEHVERELGAWYRTFAPSCTILFHDYVHQPYGILRAANAVLPTFGFEFVGVAEGSIVGVWRRSEKRI